MLGALLCLRQTLLRFGGGEGPSAGPASRRLVLAKNRALKTGRCGGGEKWKNGAVFGESGCGGGGGVYTLGDGLTIADGIVRRCRKRRLTRQVPLIPLGVCP